jgi:Tfp pilus assembly protein FimT
MEVMVVLVLFAILAAVLIPEMKGSFEDALLRSSGRKLVDVFNLAYSRSISLNQLHRVHLDKSSGHYIIEKQVGEGLADADFEPITDMPGFKGEIDTRISVDIQKQQEATTDDPETNRDDQALPSNDAISFFPDGTAEACDILLRDRMGFKLVLQINPTTARAHVLAQDRL